MNNENTGTEVDTGALNGGVEGTSEETGLTVKKLGNEWIVENGLGESLASTADCESAIGRARELSHGQHASGIAVQNEDGTLREALHV